MKFYKDEWEELIANCGFTDDELEIVHLLMRGWYEEDIAAELGYSRRTIGRRKRIIKAKISRYIVKAQH